LGVEPKKELGYPKFEKWCEERSLSFIDTTPFLVCSLIAR